MPALTEESFRALARSAPWRFTTLHLRQARTGGDPVEAWLTRPGRLRVRTAEGRVHVVLDADRSSSVVRLDRTRAERVRMRRPAEVAVQRDADGFVLARPGDPDIAYDDPLWGSYDWVAMLDPVELSSGTVIHDVTVTTRYGRTTWWARLSATADYAPRCGCCPLLWGEVSERLEGGIGGPSYAAAHPDVEYPGSWLVGLDLATGVVVSSEPLGGDRSDLGFTVTIHAVDEPMADSFFAT